MSLPWLQLLRRHDMFGYPGGFAIEEAFLWLGNFDDVMTPGWKSVMFSPVGISSLATMGDKLEFSLDVPSHRVPLIWDLSLTWPGKNDKLFLADVERISEGCTPDFRADHLMVPVPIVGVQLTTSRSTNSLWEDVVICVGVQSLSWVPCAAVYHGASRKLSLLGDLLDNLGGRITSDLLWYVFLLAIAGKGDGVAVLVRCRCI